MPTAGRAGSAAISTALQATAAAQATVSPKCAAVVIVRSVQHGVYGARAQVVYGVLAGDADMSTAIRDIVAVILVALCLILA